MKQRVSVWRGAANSGREPSAQELPGSGRVMPLIALMGGPGAGKTTVIDALRARGCDCVS
jgi:Ni2+-binding GTPase involved in maturation of urease and hydrogenase